MKKESFVIKTITTSFDNTQVLLEGQLIIRNAAIIKRDLLIALNNSQKLELIFKSVTKVDVAFLQLLIALQKSAANLRKKVLFDMALTDYMKSVIKNSGLERNLVANFEA